MKKDYLIIGNANSIFVKELASNVLLGTYQITIVTVDNSTYSDFYKEAGIEVISLNGSIFHGIPRVRVYASRSQCQKLLARKRFDVIHVMQVDKWVFGYLPEKAFEESKIIVTFYGSDLLRANDAALSSYLPYLEKTHAITIPSKIMADKFHSFYGDKFDQKLHMNVLETSTLSDLSKIMADEGWDSIQKSKEFYGISPKHTTIAIGYNNKREQNHIGVLEVLGNSSEIMARKEDIEILLQMTYGGESEEYFGEVEETLNKYGFSYKIFRDYMDGYHSIRFRLASDIMIHAQPTDAFSASIREHLACGSYVLNPRKINYEEYKKNNIFYEEYDELSDLPTLVSTRLAMDDPRVKENFNAVQKYYSFEEYVAKWKRTIE